MDNSLVLTKREPRLTVTVRFGITLTAIAWWFQRAFQTTQDDLMTEMAALAKVSLAELPNAEAAFAIPALHGGSWCALKSSEPATAHIFPDIQTFVSTDSHEVNTAI
jgi:hypothetical protein